MTTYYLSMLTAGLKTAIVGLLILASARDIMTRTVPNWMPAALAVSCAALASFNFRLAWGLGFGCATFLLSLLCWLRSAMTSVP